MKFEKHSCNENGLMVTNCIYSSTSCLERIPCFTPPKMVPKTSTWNASTSKVHIWKRGMITVTMYTFSVLLQANLATGRGRWGWKHSWQLHPWQTYPHTAQDTNKVLIYWQEWLTCLAKKLIDVTSLITMACHTCKLRETMSEQAKPKCFKLYFLIGLSMFRWILLIFH